MNRIRILAVSDVHGCIFPERYSDRMTDTIGLARLSTLIDSLRDENTLVLDNGDTIQGSPLAFFHAERHPDEIPPVTAVMNQMEFDYVNVGNHDFSYGEEILMMHLQNLKAHCITNNWYFHGKPFGPTYVIREMAGKKIALFGLVTQYIPHWESKAHLKHFRFHDACESAKKTVELIRKLENPDYIICMYHGGFERDLNSGYLTEEDTGKNEAYRICREVRGIDVLITGHQHRSLSGKLFNTVYTQTAADGRELACIDIYPDTDTIEARLLASDLEAKTDLPEEVLREEAECQAWLDQPVGTCQADLKITDEFDARLHKSQLITMMNQALMEYTGADIAASALFQGAVGFRGPVTMRDIVSTCVYPNTITVKKITGAVLKEYLEKNAEFWTIRGEKPDVSAHYLVPNPKYYNYDMADGITYTIRISEPAGQRIVSLTRHGQPVTDDMEFTIAVNSYRAGGGGDFLMMRKCPVVQEYPVTMTEVLTAYFKNHPDADLEPVHNITVIR